VLDALVVSEYLAAAPNTAAYDAHSRKHAQYQEDLRRRGRHRPSETGRENDE